MYIYGTASSKSPAKASTKMKEQALLPMADHEKLTIAKFTSQYAKNFPLKFTICEEYCNSSKDLKFLKGDRFQAHSVKQSTVVNIEFDNRIRGTISANSSILFAILFDPNNNILEAMKGYTFEKVSELDQLSDLPLVLCSRESYNDSTPNSSVSTNELLIVRRRVKPRLGRQQLKVYSYTHKKEKTLHTNCVGSFTTKPQDIALHLSDILKHMQDIFPCKAVMFNPKIDASAALSLGPHLRAGPCVVTLMHSSIDTSLVISSTLRQGSQAKKLEVPIDLEILVKLDEQAADHMYEDTPDAAQEEPFYTNIHFGQERSRELQQLRPYPSVVEQDHHHTPQDMWVSRDTKSPPLFANHSSEEKGSFERSSDLDRPQLPPPVPRKKRKVSSNYKSTVFIGGGGGGGG